MKAQSKVNSGTLGARHDGMVVIGLGFLAGCCLAEHLTAGPWLWLALAVSVGLGFVLYGLHRQIGLALLLAAFCLGALWTLPRLSPARPAPAVYEEITGSVYGQPRLRADRRITFTLVNVSLNGAAQEGRAYASLYYGDEGAPALFDGAALRFSGRVYWPEGKSGAPRFDFNRWMLQNGMSYGLAISKGVEVLNTPDTAPVTDWAYRLRQQCRAALQSTMGDGAGLAMAMLLSDKEGVSEEEYQAFQTLGIAHVTAVSGLHVGLLGWLILWALKKLRAGRWTQLALLGLFLTLYSGLTGFSAASTRASVMLLLSLLYSLWGRRGDPLTTLATAMTAVLVVQPLQALSAGFVLSFSAVAAIMLLDPGFKRGLDRLLPTRPRKAGRAASLREGLGRFGDRALEKLKQTFSLSLAAQLGVLLPTALYYHALPLYGVAVNLLLIPLIGVLVPLYGLALLLSPVPLAGLIVGRGAALGGSALLWLVKSLSALPYASLRVASPAPVWLFAGFALLTLLSRAIRLKRWRRALAALLVCAVAGASAYALRPPDTRYVQLAVGQADAALLFSGDQTVAIDVGADGSATLDYLMASGRNLDALFLTHLHQDHVNGVAALLDAGVVIRQVYLPLNGGEQRIDPESAAVLERLIAAQIPVTQLASGDELRYNEAVVKVLWPQKGKARKGQDANELPLALAVEIGEYTLLNVSDLTGDYEKYAAVSCDVLKVAHHGSNDSTGDDFLTFVSPSAALISCSSGSRQLPGAETLNRLWERGIPTFRTDEAGDISLWVENHRLIIAPYKPCEAVKQ